MPDTGAPWNIPYVAASDLVKDWPTDNQEQAEAIADALDRTAIRQVLQTVKTDTFSTSSTSFTDVTGMSVSITPSDDSNKILVVAFVNASDGAAATAHYRLTGGNADDFVGDAAGSNRVRAAFSVDRGLATSSGMAAGTIVYLDSPATASSVTYQLQVRVDSATAVYLNRTRTDTDDARYPRGASSITAIEVTA